MITETEAQAVTNFYQFFKGNTNITNFSESSYFRNVTYLNREEFKGCTNL
jgi:hypothetical protein